MNLYRPTTITVKTASDGQNVDCLSYRFIDDDQETLPSPHYKSVIVHGARMSGLPMNYIKSLEAHPTNSYRGTCEQYDRVIDLCKMSKIKLPTLD